MRRLRIGARAGRAAGHRVSGTVEVADQRFAIDVGNREIDGVRQAFGSLAEERRTAAAQPVFEFAAQLEQALRQRRPARTASSQATPKPTIAATFSVPERKPRSWPPPAINGSSSSRLSSTSAAAPFGPPILCADTVSACTPGGIQTAKIDAILPTACTASV
jgi:hypothetical protein